MIFDSKKDIIIIWLIAIVICIPATFCFGKVNIVNLSIIVLGFLILSVIHECFHGFAIKLLRGNASIGFTAKTKFLFQGYIKFDDLIVTKLQFYFILLLPQILAIVLAIIGFLTNYHVVCYSLAILSIAGGASDLYILYKVLILPKGKVRISTSTLELIKGVTSESLDR